MKYDGSREYRRWVKRRNRKYDLVAFVIAGFATAGFITAFCTLWDAVFKALGVA